MKRKYDYATRLTPALLRGYKVEVYRTKLILRKLVREAVIAAYAYDGAVHVQEARAHQIARKLVP